MDAVHTKSFILKQHLNTGSLSQMGRATGSFQEGVLALSAFLLTVAPTDSSTICR